MKLLPCPFCGGEGIVRNFTVKGGRPAFAVLCANQACPTHWANSDPSSAMEAWNTRAPYEELVAAAEKAQEWCPDCEGHGEMECEQCSGYSPEWDEGCSECGSTGNQPCNNSLHLRLARALEGLS